MFKRIAFLLFGTGARAFVALLGIAGVSVSVANYTMTQGVGTDFGSRVNSAVHYAQMLVCDMNVAGVSGACAAVLPANTVTSTTTAIAVAVANTNTNGQKTMTASSPVVIASDQSAVPASQSGTWTVQPGNTQNTTPWLTTQIALTIANGAHLVSGTTAAMIGTTSTSLVTAVTSQSLYITRVKCNNTSSTATLVQIRDGSAGTVLDTLAAGATYGGEQGTGSTPLFWTTAGNALFAQNVTTGASVICTASGYSG